MVNELSNCPSCSALFIKTKFRDVCQDCFKKEEALFDKVYQYIRKKENRKATIQQVIDDTGIDEDLLFKFIKTGRLKIAPFPNLGYKCEKCGAVIREGILCAQCSNSLLSELKVYQQDEDRKREMEEKDKRVTFHTKER